MSETLQDEVERLRGELLDAQESERWAFQAVGMADGHARIMAKMIAAGEITEARVMAGHVLGDERPEVRLELTPEGRTAVRGWPILAIAHAIGETIDEMGVENFCEWSVTVMQLGFTITVQRADGETPGKLRAKAEETATMLRASLAVTTQERDELLAEVERLRVRTLP